MNQEQIKEARELLEESIDFIELLSVYMPEHFGLITHKIKKSIEILGEELEGTT